LDYPAWRVTLNGKAGFDTAFERNSAMIIPFPPVNQN
jgi:hypothetical protein